MLLIDSINIKCCSWILYTLDLTFHININKMLGDTSVIGSAIRTDILRMLMTHGLKLEHN